MNIFEIKLTDRTVKFGFQTIPSAVASEIIEMLDSKDENIRLEGIVSAMYQGLKFVDGFGDINQTTVVQILRDNDLKVPLSFACSVLTRVPWAADFIRADGTRLPITILKQDAETRELLMAQAAMVGNLVSVDIPTFH